ncbi:hypothetical protein BZG35_07005 [Brevundimonas sp. LM2]|uniref:hypothetical protein n=1 Tax=Brevundimonas sp. LM2 TaxID=1938605 RepID=UPI00098395BB|nr:hypothetical protein [Brevundimonas sp. LM2]AQR61430.1 hypothetical protein BZG35_07005 [Brevundimonas sp. LM2]
MQTFEAGSILESLSALQGSELVANGCVNLIALDAIRDRAGPLWDRKQQLVWDFTETKLRDRLGPHDLLVRVDDTTFMVAVMTDYATAAQAVCLRVLEEILLHFIGRVDRADVRLRRVDRIEGDEVVSSALDPSRIPRLEDTARAAVSIAPSSARERELNPLFFTSISGRDLRVDFSPRPVTSLQHGVLTAIHLARTIVDVRSDTVLTGKDQDGLTDGDLIRIDKATLDYACLFNMGDHSAGYVALIIPVSYRSLLNRRGREAFSQAGAGHLAMKTGSLFEISDLDLGTPPSRMDEAVAVGRTLCRGVIVRLPEQPGSLAPFTNAGFAGLTVPLARHGAEAVKALRQASSRSDVLKRAFRALIALDAPPRSMAQLQGLGFTHASPAVDVERGALLRTG